MAEVIKLKTYGYDYIDYNLPAVKDEEGNELPREPQHWFVTLRADINPEKVRAHLSESLKQDIDDYIYFFNNERPQAALNYLTPAQFKHFYYNKED